jgi:cytidylate kinase
MTPTQSGFQQAASYLNIHLTHAGPDVHAHPLGPFVTISRESGLGGNAFAQVLAPRLPQGNDHPWSVYSANLIDEMLRTNQLPAHLAKFLPEDHVSEFNATIGEVVGLHPNLWMLVSKTNEMIRRIARGGNAVLLGRGANFATADLPGGVHLRLVAREAYRDACAARRLGVDLAEASAWNARRDAARRRYVKANFSANIAEPAAYDYVINLERVPLEAAVEIIVDAVARISPPTAALANRG